MKNIPRLRLPRNYPWRVLTALAQDLQGYLHEEFLKKLVNIVRKRDVMRLLELPAELDLQSINLVTGGLPGFRALYQITSLLKKFPFDVPEIDRRRAAYESFYTAEKKCLVTNKELIRNLRSSSEPDTLAVMTYARNFVSRVLGQIPNWESVTRDCRHGPGATLSTSDGYICNYYKYRDWPYDVTKAALPYALAVIQQDERWVGALDDSFREVFELPKHVIINQDMFWSTVFNVVESNRVTTVPKNALTERTIAIEPTMNLYLQLGVDGYIRHRLKAFGVDLDHGQDWNRELARRGSVDGDFATIDLKAASDTVSIELCRYMLPPLWFSYLMALRSPTGWAEGINLINYEKISSMGNGFTFALESLLFTSIIYGVEKHYLGQFRFHNHAVYGDDLIVRHEIAPMVVYYLGKIGFTVNSEKSFFKGDFRESCGADWLKGHLVRPIFLDKEVVDVSDLFSIRNRIRWKLEDYFDIEDSGSVTTLDIWVPEKLLGLIGPPDTEVFSSYRHMSYPYGKRRMPNSYSWRIKELQSRSGHVKGQCFFFRKLMNPLRSFDEPPWHEKVKKGLKDVGGYYHITRRTRVVWCITSRVVNDWPSRYLAMP